MLRALLGLVVRAFRGRRPGPVYSDVVQVGVMARGAIEEISVIEERGEAGAASERVFLVFGGDVRVVGVGARGEAHEADEALREARRGIW